MTIIFIVLGVFVVAATLLGVSAVILGARMERWSEQATGEEGP
jgi:hypothetical protein